MTAFVTGSRRMDIALFAVLATAICLASLRLAVHYRAPDPPAAATTAAESQRSHPAL